MTIINVVVQGCCHGELSKIYSQIEKIEYENKCKIDLLICCGDFQSIRNKNDLACMSVPDKYKEMGDFYMYYNGERKAKITTIFIGGNHEASNYLWELPYGGWVAENIYYMGYSNSIIYKGIKISGISGIYKKYNYEWNHYERPPFTNETIKSIYHSRSIDIYRLNLLKNIDIFISHDWPTDVYKYNDITELLKIKPYFKNEIEMNKLGDPNKFKLMKKIKPKYWISAHLHCYYESIIIHENQKKTNFIALDKCIKNKCTLKILKIDNNIEENLNDENLYYDRYWIEILKITEKYIKNNNEKYKIDLPENFFNIETNIFTENEIKNLIENDNEIYKIPKNFIPNILQNNLNELENFKFWNVLPLYNEQTYIFCQKFKLNNPCLLNDNNNDYINNKDEIDLTDF